MILEQKQDTRVARDIVIRYFPFGAVALQLALAIFAGAGGIVVFSAEESAWAGCILIGLGVIIAAQAVLLRDLSTLAVESCSNVLRISHRKWYLPRETSSEIPLETITAIVLRHMRAYKQDGASGCAMHYWQMFVETDGMTYTPLFPDYAPVFKGKSIAQRLSSHIGVPWRKEETAEYGRWVG